MKLITKADLERWASSFTSKGDFPLLISRLIRASDTSSDIEHLDMPSGNSVFIGGWDGIITTSPQKKDSYVPSGTSLWEFGTTEKSTTKANKDFSKRSKDPLGYSQGQCTFVFVTPHYWDKKGDWVKEQKEKKVWKDVKVYDSSDLEQWLDKNQAVSMWFAHLIGLPYSNHENIDTAEKAWEYWSIYKNIKLAPSVITAGREQNTERILKFLQSEPNIMFVRAKTKNEAVAFIIASAMSFPDKDKDIFFAKTLVVNQEGSYKGIANNFTNPLYLIPTFESKIPMYSAVSHGHHVIVPLGGDDPFDKDVEELPIIDRDGQIKGLVASGLDEETAQKVSREAARDITIIKRLIGMPYANAKWLETENIRDIIPALLLGRWDETYLGDIELLEKLSGKPYEDYSIVLTKWRNLENSPILQIGETWRLTSPLDLWGQLALHLTKKDVENLAYCFQTAFANGNPVIPPKDENDWVTAFNKKRKYSEWIREGISQSLILVAHFGDALKVSNLPEPQIWVDNIVHQLLKDADSNLWVSLNKELPLISEASHSSFLNAVNESLAKEKPEIMAMFTEERGIIAPNSHHVGLLWALEGLAWLPDYLADASLALMRLAKLDLGGTLSNRPFNSLTEIFKVWHYQTLATFEDRMLVLENIVTQEKQKGWELLIRLLPDGLGSTAFYTRKMRWRMFSENTKITYTWEEIFNTYTKIVSFLLQIFDNSESKFAEIVETSTNIPYEDRHTILDWAEKVCSHIPQTEGKVWDTLRKILSHHRSHPTAKWALPAVELEKYENLYKKLTPSDTLKQYLWLFEEHSPDFPEGFEYDEKEFEKRHEQRTQKVDDARKEAAQKIIAEQGLSNTLTLRKTIKQLWALGNALAKIVTNEADIFVVCDCLNDSQDQLPFIRSFIAYKAFTQGNEWVLDLAQKLQKQGKDATALANILTVLRPSKQFWEFIPSFGKDVEDEYWQNVQGGYKISTEENIFLLQKLIEYKRFFSVIYEIYLSRENIPSSLIVEVLRKTVSEPASETATSNLSYQIKELLEVLDKRDDVEEQEIALLEWAYIDTLSLSMFSDETTRLHKWMATDPDFFIEILRYAYRPDDEEQLQEDLEEVEELSEDAFMNRATKAFSLLQSWKAIPSMESNGSINETVLKEWIEAVRDKAIETHRLGIADNFIGQMLAQYPENEQEETQEKIFAIIQGIESKQIESAFSVGLTNKRSWSSRAWGEGGTVERAHEKYFNSLAEKHRVKYPKASRVFRNLAKGYKQKAKEEDQRAERLKLDY